MQNQSLLRISVGKAYYRRQIRFYTFVIVIHREGRAQTKNDFYVGGNEVLSCPWRFVSQFLLPGHTLLEILSAQNRNFVLMCALMGFTQNRSLGTHTCWWTKEPKRTSLVKGKYCKQRNILQY